MRLSVHPASCVFRAIRVLAETLSDWASLVPLSIKNCTVRKCLDSLPVELAILPVALVLFSVLPNVKTMTVRLVIEILSGVLRAVHVYSLSEAMSLPISEVALIEVPVRPNNLALSIRQAINDLALILEAPIESY